MGTTQHNPLSKQENTCGSLLYELQIIWDEVGESDIDRDKMLYDLEQECLDVYRKKVDQANQSRAYLRQAIADAEAELASICSAMGERPVHIRQSEKKARSLKEELNMIIPQLEEIKKRKVERKNQFLDILDQIHKVSNEIHGSDGKSIFEDVVHDIDLSTRKLEELWGQLHTLQNEKSDRLKQVMQHLNELNSLCLVLGLHFKQALSEIHPSLSGSEESYGISNDTIQCLESSIKRMRELKVERMQKLQDLATTMLELWNLMDTPIEEQQSFQNVTCNIAASEEEMNQPNMLSSDFIKHVEEEVSRLEKLKSSKMKELVLRKRSELEDICRRTHMLPQTEGETKYLIEAIESGALNSTDVLEQIELEIAKVKEEAFSRKEILDLVEKWRFACEEESWLEEYNMNENRYNAGRGSHLILKRAEKARALTNKLPGMAESLATKVKAWENGREMEFMYDGNHLLSMLEEDAILRQEKEQEKKRQREQKKLQIIAEQEALFGSNPSPIKLQSGKKASRTLNGVGGNNGKKLSIGGTMLQTPRSESAHSTRIANPRSRTVKKADQYDHISHNAEDDLGANVKRKLDMAPMKCNSFNGREPESLMIRRPFSPISTTTSSIDNDTNSFEDHNKNNCDTTQKMFPNTKESQEAVTSTSFAATPPSKMHPCADDENKTPKAMKLHVSTTRTTIFAPMHTDITPAPPCDNNTDEEDPHEEIEYSFEERRAGFVLPDMHVKQSIQV